MSCVCVFQRCFFPFFFVAATHYFSSLFPTSRCCAFFPFYFDCCCCFVCCISRRHMNIKRCCLTSWHFHSRYMYDIYYGVGKSRLFIGSGRQWWRYSRCFYFDTMQIVTLFFVQTNTRAGTCVYLSNDGDGSGDGGGWWQSQCPVWSGWMIANHHDNNDIE